MEERYGRPDGPSAHSLVLKSHSEVLAVESERDLTLVHVEVHPENAFFLERLAIFTTLSVTTVSQLAKAVKSKSEIVVTKGVAHAEFLLSRDADFEFVLGARVRYNLPVVLPVHKWSI